MNTSGVPSASASAMDFLSLSSAVSVSTDTLGTPLILSSALGVAASGHLSSSARLVGKRSPRTKISKIVMTSIAANLRDVLVDLRNKRHLDDGLLTPKSNLDTDGSSSPRKLHDVQLFHDEVVMSEFRGSQSSEDPDAFTRRSGSDDPDACTPPTSLYFTTPCCLMVLSRQGMNQNSASWVGRSSLQQSAKTCHLPAAARTHQDE